MIGIKQIQTFLVFFSCILSSGQTFQDIPEAEIASIIKLAVDLPELQGFYHFEEIPSRSPLVIREFSAVNSTNLKGLEKFGEPIQVLDDKMIRNQNITAYLSIADWTFVDNRLRVQMIYAIEGILINLMLNKVNGNWEVVDSLIVEE